MSINSMEEKQFKEEPFLMSATCMKLKKIDSNQEQFKFFGLLPKAPLPS